MRNDKIDMTGNLTNRMCEVIISRSASSSTMLNENAQFTEFISQLKQKSAGGVQAAFEEAKGDSSSAVIEALVITDEPLVRAPAEIFKYGDDADFDPTKFVGDQLIALHLIVGTLRQVFNFKLEAIPFEWEFAIKSLNSEPFPYFGVTEKDEDTEEPGANAEAEIQLAIAKANWELNVPSLFSETGKLLGHIGGCLESISRPEYTRSLQAINAKIMPLLSTKETPLENLGALEGAVMELSGLDLTGIVNQVLGSEAVQSFVTSKLGKKNSRCDGIPYESLPAQIEMNLAEMSETIGAVPDVISEMRTQMQDLESAIEEFANAKEDEPVEVDAAPEPQVEASLLLRALVRESLVSKPSLLVESASAEFDEMVKVIKETATTTIKDSYEKALAGEFEDQFGQEEEEGGAIGFLTKLFGKKEEFDATKNVGDQILSLWWITFELKNALSKLAFGLRMLIEFELPELQTAQLMPPGEFLGAEGGDEAEDAADEDKEEADGEQPFHELYYEVAAELGKILGTLEYELSNPTTAKYMTAVNKVLLPTLKPREDVLGLLESLVAFIVATEKLNAEQEAMRVLQDKNTLRFLGRSSTHPNVRKNANDIVKTNIPELQTAFDEARQAVETFATEIIQVEQKLEDEQVAAGGEPLPLVQTPLIESIRKKKLWDR